VAPDLPPVVQFVRHEEEADPWPRGSPPC